MAVKSNLYVSNAGIYVKQNVNIESTGNIYLRNEAQLLQGTTSSSTNFGLGKISLFQEGSGNQYQYNYFCSPVGGVSAGSGNLPFGISMLNRPTTETNSTPAITTAQPGYNGTSNPLKIEPYWIWKFLSGGSYTDWVHAGNNSTIAAGEGFTMKGTMGIDSTSIFGVQNNPDGSHQRYDFRGRPNDGDITINVLNNQFTLTGNPYPSAIDLSAFLFDATNTTGTAYFWESDKSVNSHFVYDYVGGYGTFSPVSLGGTGIYVPATFYTYDAAGNPIASSGSGVNYERRFSPVGQGFMVMGSANGTAIMKNQYRTFVKEGVSNFSQFEKNSAQSQSPNIASVSNFDYRTVSSLPIPQIRFKNTIGINGAQIIALGFDSLATDGVDFGKDAPSPKELTEQEFYFLQNNKPYVINVIDFDVNKRIPVGFRNQQVATYKISVAEMINFTGTSTVYLHDKINDIYLDIVNNVYEITLPIGDNKTQYEITFRNSSALSISDNAITDFDVLQNNSTQTLNILNSKNLNLLEVSLFDMAGKLVLNKSKLGTKQFYKINTSGIAEGIYIAKLLSEDGKYQSKKISITKVR